MIMSKLMTTITDASLRLPENAGCGSPTGTARDSSWASNVGSTRGRGSDNDRNMSKCANSPHSAGRKILCIGGNLVSENLHIVGLDVAHVLDCDERIISRTYIFLAYLSGRLSIRHSKYI